MHRGRLTSVLLRSAALFWTGVLMLQTAEAADIGLKISAEKNWLSWGDYILGQDMKSGLERLGYSVQPAYMDNFYHSGAARFCSVQSAGESRQDKRAVSLLPAGNGEYG